MSRKILLTFLIIMMSAAVSSPVLADFPRPSETTIAQSTTDDAWFRHSFSFRYEMSPNGRFLASMTTSTFRVFDLGSYAEAPKLIIEQPFHSDVIDLLNRSRLDLPHIAFSSDRQWVAASFPDEDWVQHTIYIWDLITGEIIARLTHDFYAVTALAFRPTTHTLAIAGQYGMDYWMGEITFFDVITQHIVSKHRPLGGFIQLAFNADGTMMMISTANGTGSDMYTLNLATGYGGGGVMGCPCSMSPTWQHFVGYYEPGGDHPMLTGTRRGYWWLTDIQNRPRGHDEVAWSHDGHYVAIAGATGKVHVIDTILEDHQIIGIGSAHIDELQLEFHPTQNILAFNQHDHQIVLWDVGRGQRIALLSGLSSSLRDIHFSPDGSRLATASNDGFVHLWDVESGEMIRRFKLWVQSVEFSPDGRLLLIYNGTLQIWRLDESES